MNQEILLQELAAILQADPAAVTLEFQLATADWDSVAVMSTIAMLDEYCGVTVSGDALARCATAGDVLKLASAS